MREPETCPKCSARFPARKALVSRGARVGYNVFSGDGPDVRCPNCWTEFPSSRLRLFGFIPVEAHRWIIGAILALCLILPFFLKGPGR